MKSDIPSAVDCFRKSVEYTEQREVKNLAKHELGWCYLLELDFPKAEEVFLYMKSTSRWSRPFYTYLATINSGAYGNLKDLSNVKEIKGILENAPKGSQLEEFLLRRSRICPVNEEDLLRKGDVFWRLLVYELLYLWNTLPNCSRETIEAIVADCDSNQDVEVMTGLRNLLAGACQIILKEHERAIESFRCCLQLRRALPNNAPDAHVSAFSQYELGTLLLKCDGGKNEGKALLQQISQFKEYDFEQRLSVRVHMILKQI